MSVDRAADEIGVSEATLYRFESGTSIPRPPDVKELCEMYGADSDIAEGLVALAKEANTPGWWRSYNGAIPRYFDTYVSLESAAETIQVYEAEMILGLLQTHRYAEGVFRRSPSAPSEEEVRRRLEVRIRRQRILDRRNPPKLDVLLGEIALVRSPGRDIMAEQLAHLDAMSRRPDVTIRMVPMGLLHCGVDFGARFTLLTFPRNRHGVGEPPVTCTDNLNGALFLDKPDEIEVFRATWNGVLEAALPPSDSRKLINEYRERNER